MKISSSLTIINDKNMRGVIAPARTLSKKMLEDIIDFIELSSPAAVKETDARLKEADRGNLWIPAKEVERRFQKRLKLSRKS